MYYDELQKLLDRFFVSQLYGIVDPIQHRNLKPQIELILQIRSIFGTSSP